MAPDEPSYDFSRFAGRVRSFLRRYASREYPVDDLVQETFVEAYESARARGPPSKPQQWILTIAKRAAIRSIRRRARHPPRRSLHDVVDEDSDDPLDKAIEREHIWQIEAGIERLPPSHKQVLEGFYLDTCSLRSLSNRLGVGYDAMKLRLCRARSKLRSIINSNLDSF